MHLLYDGGAEKFSLFSRGLIIAYTEMEGTADGDISRQNEKKFREKRKQKKRGKKLLTYRISFSIFFSRLEVGWRYWKKV